MEYKVKINDYEPIKVTEQVYELMSIFNIVLKENKALRQLLIWAEECGFGFDNIINDTFDWKKFKKETKDMNYIDSMIYYAERWVEENGQD